MDVQVEIVVLESRVNSELPELSYRSCELYSTLEERVAMESIIRLSKRESQVTKTVGELCEVISSRNMRPSETPRCRCQCVLSTAAYYTCTCNGQGQPINGQADVTNNLFSLADNLTIDGSPLTITGARIVYPSKRLHVCVNRTLKIKY